MRRLVYPSVFAFCAAFDTPPLDKSLINSRFPVGVLVCFCVFLCVLCSLFFVQTLAGDGAALPRNIRLPVSPSFDGSLCTCSVCQRQLQQNARVHMVRRVFCVKAAFLHISGEPIRTGKPQLAAVPVSFFADYRRSLCFCSVSCQIPRATRFFSAGHGALVCPGCFFVCASRSGGCCSFVVFRDPPTVLCFLFIIARSR